MMFSSQILINIKIIDPYDLKIIGDKVVRVNESGTARISCIGEGYPQRELIWRFMICNTSLPIHDTESYGDTLANKTLVLALNNIEKSQQGFYECSTQDKNDTLKQRVQIIVQSRLELIILLQFHYFKLSFLMFRIKINLFASYFHQDYL